MTILTKDLCKYTRPLSSDLKVIRLRNLEFNHSNNLTVCKKNNRTVDDQWGIMVFPSSKCFIFLSL